MAVDPKAVIRALIKRPEEVAPEDRDGEGPEFDLRVAESLLKTARDFVGEK